MAACGNDNGLTEWIYLRESNSKDPSVRMRFSTNGFHFQINECGSWINSAELAVPDVPSLPIDEDTAITKSAADISVNALSGLINIDLPPLSPGYKYNVKKVNTSGGNVVIRANSTDLIDGASTHTLLGSDRPSAYIVGFDDQWRIL